MAEKVTENDERYRTEINQTKLDIESNKDQTDQKLVELTAMAQQTEDEMNLQHEAIISIDGEIETNKNAILALKDITGNQLLSMDTSEKQSRSIEQVPQENLTLLADIHVSLIGVID